MPFGPRVGYLYILRKGKKGRERERGGGVRVYSKYINIA